MQVKKWQAFMAAAALSVATGTLYFFGSRQVQKDAVQDVRQSLVVSDGTPKKVLSRGVTELAAQYIRVSKPSPPEAARQIAYVTAAYADVITQGHSQKDALVAVQAVLKVFNPGSDVAADINKLAATYVVSPQSPQETTKPEVVAIINGYIERMAIDKHDAPWDGRIPLGSGKWVDRNAAPPLAPRAGEWKRWVLNGVPVVEAPPEAGSAELERELEAVRTATQNRNEQDVADMRFWSGAPGSDGPASIWQTELYEIIKTELPNVPAEADALYAAIQKHLAITIADAFMESWRVKYTYWTARPSMLDSSIDVAIAEPQYPSYPSGHSTVSSAAAQVLTALVPTHRGEWFEMAETARDSLVLAGVYFRVDATSGYELGELVGKQIVSSVKLQPVL